MKQTIYAKSLINGQEMILVLPMDSQKLLEALAPLGEKIEITEWEGPYPIHDKSESIIRINNIVKLLSLCAEKSSITDIAISVLFEAAGSGANGGTEALQRILKGNSQVFDITEYARDWPGTNEEKAAMYIYEHFQADFKRDEVFNYSAELPEELAEFNSDWSSVWKEYSAQGDWVICKRIRNEKSEIWLVYFPW